MVNEELQAIAKCLHEALDPATVYLFGSFAKGNARPDSDYDLYIVVPDDAGSTLELSRRAYAAIREVRNRPADIIVKHESVFRDRAEHNTIERTVLQEGVKI